MRKAIPSTRRSRVGAALITIALAVAGVAMGAGAAQAAQPAGCSVYAGVPYKSGSQISGSGSGTCSTSAQRTWVYEIHRSEGWWHPTVSAFSWSGNRSSYWGSTTKCDAGSGSGTRQYFGQSYFSGYSAVLSGNTGELSICD